MTTHRAKKYCIADGCRNNDKNSDLSFFCVPTDQKDVERTRTWLTLLGREDLLEKKELKRNSYLVCSAHFDPSSIKIIKRLEENAVPTKLLANQPNTSCSIPQPIAAQCAQSNDTAIVSSKCREGTSTSNSAMPSSVNQSSFTKQTKNEGNVVVISRNWLKRKAENEPNEEETLSEEQTQTSTLLSEGISRKKPSNEL